MKEQFRHIGRETHRILGSDIVTGKAMYVADNKVPGMKYGKILRSPYPFARIVSVDKSEARRCLRGDLAGYRRRGHQRQQWIHPAPPSQHPG